MNGPTAAVVIFFLLMCVKRLLLSLTPLLRYDTHVRACANTNTNLNNLIIIVKQSLKNREGKLTGKNTRKNTDNRVAAEEHTGRTLFVQEGVLR